MNQVRDKGLATVLESAKQAGLPLLERDLESLTRLTQDVARLKGVVNISIIDHKNKIIAYTDPDQLLPISSKAVQLKDGTKYWPHILADGTQAICFSTDIVFAGTKIGEVFLAMDADGSRRIDHGVFSFRAGQFSAYRIRPAGYRFSWDYPVEGGHGGKNPRLGGGSRTISRMIGK